MPIYEFACVECGHGYEEYRKAGARPNSRCPKCGGRARKVFRPVGIIFKGSGFHSTDYRKAADKAKGEGEKAKPAAPEKGRGSD